MCKCLCGVLEWLPLGLMVPHPHTGLLSGCACSCTGSQSSPVLFKKVTFSSTLTIHCFLDESPSDSEVESLCINQPLSKEASSLKTARFCGCRLLKQWVVAGSYCGFLLLHRRSGWIFPFNPKAVMVEVHHRCITLLGWDEARTS